jgi:CRP-like cAMP-binding protein
VEDRLQHLLLLMKRDIGQSVAEGTRLSVRLTHQNLANAIGTTRVTVTRLLSKLKSEGAISLDRDRHIILNNDSFKNVAEW